jgi:hypothetical protein
VRQAADLLSLGNRVRAVLLDGIARLVRALDVLRFELG